MTIYLILLSLLIFLAYNSRRVRYADWIGLLLILIVSCLRSRYVGIDLERYVDQFLGIVTSEKERGYELYIKFIQQFTNLPQIFIALTSIFSIIPIFLFFKKVSVNVSLSLLLYLLLRDSGLFFTFTGLRQALSTAILVWVFYFYDHKKILYAGLLLSVAFLFHKSAVFILPFLLLVNLKINRNIGISLLIGTAIYGFTGGFGIESLFNYFKYINFSAFTVFEKLNAYNFYADYESNLTINFFGMFTLIVPNTFLAIYTYYKGLDNFYTRIFVIGVIITNILVSHPIVFRYAMAFTLMQTITFPMLVNIRPRKMIDILIQNVFLIYMCFFFIYYYFKMGANVSQWLNNVVPYHFFFE